MSAIIEPYGATWHLRGDDFLIEATCDGDVIIHTKSGGTIALGVDELADMEAALLNARLWLERATKQRDELKAADETSQDEPHACVWCGHSKLHTASGCPLADCLCFATARIKGVEF